MINFTSGAVARDFSFFRFHFCYILEAAWERFQERVSYLEFSHDLAENVLTNFQCLGNNLFVVHECAVHLP
jgi:hypothetical protein